MSRETSAPGPIHYDRISPCHPDCRRQRNLPATTKTVWPRDPKAPFTCPLAVAMKGFKSKERP